MRQTSINCRSRRKLAQKHWWGREASSSSFSASHFFWVKHSSITATQSSDHPTQWSWPQSSTTSTSPEHSFSIHDAFHAPYPTLISSPNPTPSTLTLTPIDSSLQKNSIILLRRRRRGRNFRVLETQI
jgi:hypothetical protein